MNAQIAIPQIINAMPHEWRGTTFANADLLGREEFAKRVTALVTSTAASGKAITTEDLVAVGNAEDYLRVATNISTVLELFLADSKDLEVNQVNHDSLHLFYLVFSPRSCHA